MSPSLVEESRGCRPSPCAIATAFPAVARGGPAGVRDALEEASFLDVPSSTSRPASSPAPWAMEVLRRSSSDSGECRSWPRTGTRRSRRGHPVLPSGPIVFG